MNIPFQGKELELKFDLDALKVIDKRVGIDTEEIQLGQGLGMLVPGLESGNILTVAAAVEGGLSHLKNKFGSAYIPNSNAAMFEVLDEIAERDGDLDVFAQGVIDELGKRAVTRSMLPDELKAKYKQEAEEAKKAATPQPVQEAPQEQQTQPMS